MLDESVRLVPSSSTRSADLTRATLLIILLAGVAVRVAYAVGATGLFHPDDIHQTLEPAHGVVYGVGLRFWEFERGARPWTAPGVYVVLLGFLKWLGVTAPGQYMLVVRVFNALIAATWPYLCYRIARGLSSRRAGLIAAALCAVWHPFILLAPRSFANLFSITFALWACARAVDGGTPAGAPFGRRAALACGLLLGISFAFRAQEWPAILGLLTFIVASGHLRMLPWVFCGAAGPVLGAGVLDWITWGLPFHSVFDYVHSTMYEGYADQFEHMPWHFLFGRLGVLLGLGLALLAALPLAPRRALVFGLTVGGVVLGVHAVIPHKEFRYVLTGVVSLLAVTATGIAALSARFERASGSRRVAHSVIAVLVALWTGASAVRARAATFVDYGLYAGLAEAKESPWRFRRDANRALAHVSAQADLCGVALFPFGPAIGQARLASTGGYTYLHRGVPLVIGLPPPDLHRFINYVIVCPGERGALPAFRDLPVSDHVGTCVIYRRPEAVTCGSAELAPFSRSWRRTR
ncbi:MAG TPA: hypothetical protein VGQ83_12080 [Polyangia bacterium]|jgi:hypothetical protein